MISEQELILILNEKKRKIRKKVVKKFTYPWSENQLSTMENIISNAPRIRIKNEVYRFSVLSSSDFIENDNFLINFFFHYYENVKNLKQCFDFTYIDFNIDKEKLYDNYEKDASFNGFNFSHNSLITSVLEEKIFIPFYGYKNKTKDKIAICGGRHRMQVLKAYSNYIPFKFLCIFWDSYKEGEYSFYVPKILFEKSLYNLKVEKQDLNNNFYKLKIINPVDMWLCLKAMDKEMSYIIDFYKNRILDLKITPPENITWKEN